jgi:short-chain 2-methylacyl-CoA dehydrogenase
MNFDLTDEQRTFRDVVRAFAEDVVRPGAAERDEHAEFPIEVVRRMADLGLFGLPFPEEYGGSGADAVTVCLAIEELGRVDQSVGITLSAAVGLGGSMVHRFGTPDQRERWLGPIARGEILASFALTEPGGGSDAAAVSTTARPGDGAWTIDGAKAFITNCGTPMTGLHVVAAASEPGGGARGLSTFLVPADADGVAVEPAYRKLGWHASDTHGLVFSGCRVPEDALLGERGRGFAQCLEVLTDARITISALAVGLAQACLDESVRYAIERDAFGAPIGARQLIQGKLADMRVGVEAARLLTYRAAWLKDQGRDHVVEASVAKLVASETAVACAREAVQIHGGYGFIEEYPVARFYRDAKVLEIGEGTSEIHRLIVARDLGLPGTFSP